MNPPKKLIFRILLVLNINYTNAQSFDNNLILDLLNSNTSISHDILKTANFRLLSEIEVSKEEILFLITKYSNSSSCCIAYDNENIYKSSEGNIIVLLSKESDGCIYCKKNVSILLLDNKYGDQFLRLKRYYKSMEGVKETNSGSNCFMKVPIDRTPEGSYSYQISVPEFEICFNVEIISNDLKLYQIKAKKNNN